MGSLELLLEPVWGVLPLTWIRPRDREVKRDDTESDDSEGEAQKKEKEERRRKRKVKIHEFAPFFLSIILFVTWFLLMYMTNLPYNLILIVTMTLTSSLILLQAGLLQNDEINDDIRMNNIERKYEEKRPMKESEEALKIYQDVVDADGDLDMLHEFMEQEGYSKNDYTGVLKHFEDEARQNRSCFNNDEDEEDFDEGHLGLNPDKARCLWMCHDADYDELFADYCMDDVREELGNLQRDINREIKAGNSAVITSKATAVAATASMAAGGLPIPAAPLIYSSQTAL